MRVVHSFAPENRRKISLFRRGANARGELREMACSRGGVVHSRLVRISLLLFFVRRGGCSFVRSFVLAGAGIVMTFTGKFF